jgi:hypothetical protein
MGTRALGGGPLLVADDDLDRDLAAKRALLALVRDEVSVRVDDGRSPAAVEAAALVRRHAVRSAGPDPDRAPTSVATPPPIPLEGAALRVQEDLVVLVRSVTTGEWVVHDAVVCFPSHWSPPEKVGLGLGAVHGPVPAYAEELDRRVDRFLDRLGVGRAAWRRNWTIHRSPALHVPRPPVDPTPAEPVDLWLRSERQVLWALPESGGVLFTIRTQQVPLPEVSRAPAVAEALAAALRASPPATRAYRGLTDDEVERTADALQRWAGPVGGSRGPDRHTPPTG